MDIKKRLHSLDALRGFDMLFILGLASLIVSICELFPGGADCALARNMTHVAWDGMRHHDTIFPLFLFIAGISYPFSYASQIAKGRTQGQIYAKIFYRGFMLVFINLLYNGLLNFDFVHLRYTGVLARIGMAWMFSALIFVTFKKNYIRWIIAASLLIGYWLLLRFVPAPDMPAGTDPFSIEGNLCGYIDRNVIPGRFYQDFFDPEGILSTIPAIVTAMLGMFTGQFVKLSDDKISGNKKTLCMFGAAAVMLGLGLLWSLDFPINKSLWSSSFVLVVGSYSLAMFALFYWIIDVKGWKKWSFIFQVIGLNSITIYLGQRIVSLRSISHFFCDGLADLVGSAWAPVVLNFGYLCVVWFLAYFLYKQKIFLRV